MSEHWPLVEELQEGWGCSTSEAAVAVGLLEDHIDVLVAERCAPLVVARERDYAALEAENARLRAALERIARAGNVSWARHIARETLEPPAEGGE